MNKKLVKKSLKKKSVATARKKAKGTPEWKRKILAEIAAL
jgi:hypothetical protein